ncbi:probable ribosome production factor 1 [Anopheles gambiae]|uniref:probable ribosome production factor 1 n=1 Tax=Anopheles coluzzii TaxID=1518534 RepID=UPI0020FFABC9|nr:probable ribosome production factor 1 [Anopheles coluzzii]XP_319105.3 probable ribosome production factor 1 [Anopheles gambiae]
MSSSDSDSEFQEEPKPSTSKAKGKKKDDGKPKRKRLQDYLDEKAAREVAERAEELLRKRRRRGLADDEEDPEETTFPVINPMNFVKNKEIRHKQFKRMQGAKRKEEKEAKKTRKLEGIPSAPNHTIESLREKDDTTVVNMEGEDQAEVMNDLANDEFCEYYQKSYEPRVMITFNATPHMVTRKFASLLRRMIPNAKTFRRNKTQLKRVCKSAIRENYTDILVVNENRKKPEGLLLIHLPDGPTAHFKVSNFKDLKDLKRNERDITTHRPEVILNNFTTRLGLTIGRMLGALFHYEPEFRGRRAVTFHNQRDYIFFRHHLYEFDKNGKRVKLRELGPRFTLKLRSLQVGLFDGKCGDYEWMITNKRHQMESRRRFFL